MLIGYEILVFSSEKVETQQWWVMTQQTTDVHCKVKEEEELKNIFSCTSFPSTTTGAVMGGGKSDWTSY